ncbi:MAG: class I SAM-dependent methyltransferase [Bradyrhizobium sp.]|uniref:class I SAM-dependent methyltransferase n=1 Tax=Bradyrhizobium sp. TaxID=376 RepID=UPI0025BF34EC|nr:class I SAM-dependent methyltransferase [Bradyrhizobium sp.]MBI5263392.1 class I SAM-dependent methyltransferase [Bradyrhizobium sp.]
MKIQHHVYRAIERMGIRAGLRKPVPSMKDFALTGSEIQAFKDGAGGGVKAAFLGAQKRPAHKWTHYLDIYERYLSNYRDKPISFLEIGVMSGGSLDMWRRYFGEPATIVGIDIDPTCAERVDPPNIVRIGSQDDRRFLEGVINEFGAPDVVLDDGSHIGRHQRASFEILFPHLKSGGLYIIEDVHTAYWPDWEGGYKRNGSIIEYTKQMIDDLHGWYHNRRTTTPAKDEIGAIHLYDSIIVIEKNGKGKPGFLASI